MRPATPEAVNLMLQGAIALAAVEHHGIRIDVPYLEQTIADSERKITALAEQLQNTNFYRDWQRHYGDKTKLGSRQQLASLLFDKMKIPYPHDFTRTNKYRADEEVLRAVDHPFVRDYLRLDNRKRFLKVSLLGLRAETVDGFVHPFFHLHTVETYRGSSSEINFQNIPRRDEELGPLIRRAFIPRKGRVLVESDFGALEFRIAAAVWRDPEMIAYASDPSKDIHRDQSAACYRIHQDSVSKGIRDCGKNLMVFPKLYGSYYVQMAKNLWNAVGERDLKIADGTKLKQVLRAKGIRELGECNPRVPPRPGTFEYHMKAVEQDFEERFHVFTAGKDQWWSDYCKRGWFRLVTGFVIQGVYSRNFLMNAPIQGPGFHCLLWSLVEVHRQLRKRKMKTKIVGQIHDCILADCPVGEVQDYLHLVKKVITVELPRAWSWIVVPLAIEAEVTPPEGSWADKQNWDEVNGTWQLRVKT